MSTLAIPTVIVSSTNRSSLFSLNPSNSLDSGLQLALLGNNASGSTTSNDSSPNSLPGTLHNFTGSPWVVGIQREVLSTFDGSTDSRYGDCGNHTALHVQSDMSLSAWIYCTSFSTDNGIAGENGGTSYDHNANYVLWLDANGKLNATIGNGTTAVYVGPTATAVSINTWTQVGLSISGTTAQLWINGVADGSGSATVSGRIASTNFIVGVYDTLNNFYFNGSIADVMLWSRALTSGEWTHVATSSNYNLNDGTQDLCVAHTGLIANVLAFWDLDNDSNDDTGNGNNGTDTAMSYDGSKATFNGSTSRVAITGITAGTTFTISMWVNAATLNANYTVLFSLHDGTQGCYVDGGRGYHPDLYSSTFHNGTAVLNTSTLYHLVYSVNAGTCSFYVNGSLGGTSGGIGSVTFDSIGKETVVGDDPLNGTLQSVGLFSDAKDQTWVTSMYNGGTPLNWGSM